MLKSVQPFDDDNIYAFPETYQTPQHHEQLFKTAAGKAVKKTLTSRHKIANPVISLSDNLKKLYFDEEGNPTFDGLLLEPTLPEPLPQKRITTSSELPSNENTKSLHNILKDAVVKNFPVKIRMLYLGSTLLNPSANDCVSQKIATGSPSASSWKIQQTTGTKHLRRNFAILLGKIGVNLSYTLSPKKVGTHVGWPINFVTSTALSQNTPSAS